MSVTKNSSELNFYTFDDQLLPKKKISDFSFLDYEINGFKKKAYHILATKTLGPNGSLVKVDANTPNAIEVTSQPNKLYQSNGKLIFTFDNDKAVTKVVTVDPITFETSKVDFFMPPTEAIAPNHNSYLYDNKLFQIIATAEKLHFLVRNAENQETLKQIELNKNDSITFKNTPILQDGPGFFFGTRTREMEKTSKFLRKISQGDIGIIAFKKNDQYTITLGSRKEVSSGGAPMMMAGGLGQMGAIPIGGIGNMSMTFNPTYLAYSSYSSTKSVRIECLFDTDFNHLQGEISMNLSSIKTFLPDSYKLFDI